MPASILRRSVYTILVITLTVAAALIMLIPSRVAPGVSLTFAAIGVLVGLSAWASPHWRKNAGRPRHVLVLLAGLACAAICVKAVMTLTGGT